LSSWGDINGTVRTIQPLWVVLDEWWIAIAKIIRLKLLEKQILGVLEEL
jgi:hypothetical protein